MKMSCLTRVLKESEELLVVLMLVCVLSLSYSGELKDVTLAVSTDATGGSAMSAAGDVAEMLCAWKDASVIQGRPLKKHCFEGTWESTRIHESM